MARGPAVLLLLSGAAVAAGAAAPAAACAPLPIPAGHCWSDAAHRVGALADSPSADWCCASCRAVAACAVWVHWRPGPAANHSCYLYSAPAPTRPCGGTNEYVAGYTSETAPPTPAPGAAPTPPPPAPPYHPPYPTPAGAKDVLMIAVDDMRPELGAYGCGHMRTPHMDALAAESLSFDNAYVAVAWCSPSRTALLTSRRPDTSMTWSVVPSEYWRDRGGNFTTLPQYFKERGYLTLGVGKVFHGGKASGNSDSAYSWSAEGLPYDNSGGVCPMARPAGGGGGRHRDPHLDEGVLARGGAAMSPRETNPDTNLPTCANATLRRIAAQRAAGDARPFFFSVGFHKPHIPWTVPQRYYDMYPLDRVELAANAGPPVGVPTIAMNNILSGYWSNAFTDFGALRANGTITNTTPADGTVLDAYWARRARQAYWAALTFTDDNVGGVVAAARAAGLWADTIVVLWGDHGYQLGDNDQWSKVSNFEQATRIPLMIRVPGAAASGQRTSALWEAVDLLPTLTDLAMAQAPPACPATLAASRATALCTDGKSAAPLLGDPGRAGWSARAFSQVPRGAVVNGEPGDVAGEEFMGYTVRVADWRYTEWVEFDAARGVANWSTAALHGAELYPEALGRSCRFDTDAHNVAADPAHASVVSELSQMLRTIV